MGCCARDRLWLQEALQLLPLSGDLPLSCEHAQASVLEDESYAAQWLCVHSDRNELSDR